MVFNVEALLVILSYYILLCSSLHLHSASELEMSHSTHDILGLIQKIFIINYLLIKTVKVDHNCTKVFLNIPQECCGGMFAHGLVIASCIFQGFIRDLLVFHHLHAAC